MMSDAPTPTTPSSEPFRFTLRDLMLFTLVCACLAVLGKKYGAGGVFMALTILGLAGWVRGARTKAIKTRAPWIIFTFGSLFGAILSPAINVWPQHVHQAITCGSKSAMIGLALMAYEAEHGSFPPAYIADGNGKPIHSWRVLILPYLGQKALYDQYDFNEPWNGPNNIKLAKQIGSFYQTGSLYRCPSDHSNSGMMTNYVAVVGPNTAWPGARGGKLSEFSDGPQNTILLVEAANSGIHWMEPRDLDYWQISLKINDPNSPSISSFHERGVSAMFADRSSRWLRSEMPPEEVKALLTRDGGEPVTASD